MKLLESQKEINKKTTAAYTFIFKYRKKKITISQCFVSDDIVERALTLSNMFIEWEEVNIRPWKYGYKNIDLLLLKQYFIKDGWKSTQQTLKIKIHNIRKVANNWRQDLNGAKSN